jgi:class 3 adenylate cyclase/tetratricopeptide (TPR) repeat protein
MRPCPTCAGRTPAPYVVCGHCGTTLDSDQTVDEIRRFATVVNSDLKGSTALGERLDPESLREVLTLYFDEMRLVFEAHGGTIEKIIGDAIVAVFGLPVRHEDDALRAVEAAAESQQALASLNDRLEQTWGVRLVVRTGIATGDVVFGEASLGQHVLTGDTMQISSAMEQNAPPLEVLIADSTYELVREQVQVEPAEPVRPKGKDIEVPAYVLKEVAARPEAGNAAADTASAGMRLCQACGEENPEAFRFCGMCGATLGVSSTARESRKTVTLVFADPKPTTLDGVPPSPEALRDVMSRYFEAMRVALEHHGGTVEKFIGDAVMAVFGLPMRHEDDAVRAVRAAAAMQAALPELNEAFRSQWGLELRNHIGVNTGEVIAGDASLGQRLVTGDAVNTAARLEQAAGAQEIILGHLTYRLARDQVEVEPIPPLTLKGKAEPVPAYRLVSVQELPAERPTQATPFVGREAELGRLGDALRDARQDLKAQLVTVMGDAGVGKSRLIREFAGAVAGEAEVVRGRCLPYGDGITFWPIGEIVRGVAGIDEDDDAQTELAKITALVSRGLRAGDDAAAIAERVGAAIGLSATQFPLSELFWAIRRLLEALARHRPLVAIVDDVHSAAPAFLDLLDHLLEAVIDAPILLLATARHELLEAHDEWAAAHEGDVIALGPLDAGAAASIVEQLLAGLDASVRERIVAAAEGNPLYVEQITAMLLETNAIRRDDDGRWVATSSDTGQLAIPPTVQALVAARLDALPVEERAVIEPASVIGASFPVDALAALVESPVRSRLSDDLGVLTGKQLVRPSSEDAEIYRFGHVVIKDTTYAGLLKRIRASLHEQFVAWAEPVNRERGREMEFEEILGFHLEQAYRYRTELGPADEHALEVGRRAAVKLASAGRRSLARGDMTAAASLLGRSTNLLPIADHLRVELLPDLAEAQLGVGDFAASGVSVKAGVDEARTIGGAGLLARAELAGLLLALYAPDAAGEIVASVDRTRELIEGLTAEGDDAGLARAWRVMAVLYGNGGDYDAAAEAAERSSACAAAVGDQRLVARSASGYSSVAVSGSLPAALVIDRCETLLQQVRGDRKAEAWISQNLAQLHAMQGAFDRARELYHAAQAQLADLGPSISARTTSLSAARVEMLAGDLAAAEAELSRDNADLAAIGETYYRSSITAMLARVLLARDDPSAADGACREAEKLVDADDVDGQVQWRAVRARLLARAGDRDPALAMAADAVRLSRDSTDLILQADVLVDQAEVLELAEGPDAAEPPLREALKLYERKGDLVSAGRVRSRLLEGSSAPA